MRHFARLALALCDPVALSECFAVANLAFLAVDIFVAHSMNEFAHWAEWIPLGFSVLAPFLLLAAMIFTRSLKPPRVGPNSMLSATERLSRGIGLLVGFTSVTVGIAGLIWHLNSQFFADQTLKNLVYSAPFVAPLAYSGIGLLILLNRMIPGGSDEWSRWIILLALGGWIGNFVLSLADHAQNSFFYWPESIPVIASALAVGALSVAFVDYRSRSFLKFCLLLLAAQIVVGIVGWILHLITIAHSQMDTMWDRIVYSAPAFAPLLFADLAILALIGLGTLCARARSNELFARGALLGNGD